MEIMHNNFPEILHAAYFTGGVIMPHCKSKIILEGGNVEAAKLAFEGCKQLGLMQKSYDGKNEKKGCFVLMEGLKALTSTRVEVVVTGVSRFMCDKLVSVDHYVHKCLIPNYDIYQDDYAPVTQMVSLKDVAPIFSKYFVMFLSQLNLEDSIDTLNMFSIDKFINSLIMIMPMRDVERLYLSELPSFKEKEKALSMILQSNETGLTTESKYH